VKTIRSFPTSVPVPYTRRPVCTLAIYFRSSATLPLIAAANRDEFLRRPALPPRVVSVAPWVVAGQDLVGGGTWFGLNEHGMVVGLLNRTQPGGPDPTRRSRGLLCLEALQSAGPGEVLARLGRERADRYNGFNLLVANGLEAHVATNHRDVLRVQTLETGVHVLTNLDVDDPTCPRIAKSHQLFQAVPLPASTHQLGELVGRLATILSDHVTPLDPRGQVTPNTLCVHQDEYGTRSSSVIVVTPEGARFWHAPGPPCSTCYEEVPLPSSAPRPFGEAGGEIRLDRSPESE
jgi:uncharacterized protein with NRDE domain